MIDLHGRTRTFLRSWPKTSREYVARYARACRAPVPANGREGPNEPPWLVVPRWLDPRVPSDILWGQFCLFLFVRIQDDVVDGQAPSPQLVYIADEFLLESERVFSLRVPQPAFRRFVRQSLQTTVRGILRADRLQRQNRLTERAWSVYADIGAIFKVGSAAVCLAGRRHRELSLVSKFMDHLAIADQLIDDLADIDEDLRDGRVNAAARWLIGEAASRGPARARVAAALFESDRIDALFGTIGAHAERARRAIAPLGLPEAPAYLDLVDRRVAAVSKRIHHARVDALMTAVRDRAGLGAA